MCNKPTSQRCCANADTQNFQFVVKANILDNGDLDISFSSNYGVTYYTDNKVKELMYNAQKVVVVENGRRQLQWAIIAFNSPLFCILDSVFVKKEIKCR